jgi:hypothetical protein
MPLSTRTRRKHRRVFINTPVSPSFRYWLDPATVSLALGVTPVTLTRWRKTWAANDGQHGVGPEPVYFSKVKILYRWDEVTRSESPNTWLELFTRQRLEFIKNTSSPSIHRPSVKSKAKGSE